MFYGYVINLNRHPQRLQRFLAHSDAKYFERIPAIDKKVLDLLDAPELLFNIEKIKSIIGREITLGEIACTLSHISCWQKIAENPQLELTDFAVIAEDDIQLVDNFHYFLSNILQELKNRPKIEIALLHKLSLFHEGFYTASAEQRDFHFLTDNHSSLFDSDGSALYAIRKDRAIQLVEQLKTNKPYWLADHFTHICPTQNMLVLNPLLGKIVNPNDSDLEADREIARANKSV
ncbi:glycosyltransferase family 25 protein [Actinobacillus equuli]|uniref:glycosyltransferase family 25 protein n=1 Tax=Actinobacillus equuli TaxID=718 RepID=UPI00244219AD|nr:glycosyltransferase family 25 protein [Actinobacillus equuli]WGE84762.1 glycosyltransferase family 25 protein [Actinobacillus equuli subsp. haemolyticus]